MFDEVSMREAAGGWAMPGTQATFYPLAHGLLLRDTARAVARSGTLCCGGAVEPAGPPRAGPLAH